MKLLSVNIAAAGEMFITESGYTHRIMSGIFKQPVTGAVPVRRMGLSGDEQADLTVHGGLDKAVYAYPVEHYAFWMAQKQAALQSDVALLPGAVGENLTVEGILETDVWIGDRLHIGSAILEVSGPRQPCFKFNAKMGFNRAAKLMVQSGYTGFYLCVIQEGSVQAGDTISLTPGPREISIVEINERHRKGH